MGLEGVLDIHNLNFLLACLITISSKFARVAWTTSHGHNENGIWESWNSKQLLAEVSTLNRWYEDKNTEEYLNMVSSVNENKGFYISRYEAK